jgi:hypothetical protein
LVFVIVDVVVVFDGSVVVVALAPIQEEALE